MPTLHCSGAAHLSTRPVVHDSDELDRRLLAAVADGDRRSFDELVELHSAALLRFVRMLTRDDDAAEDALQETFLAAYRGAASFRGDGRVKSWLLTIARNASMKHLRSRPVVAVDDSTMDTLGIEAGWGDPADPEHFAESAERSAALRAALAELAAEDREVIVLHDLEGLTGRETAGALGLPLAATKSRLHRARLRLLAALRRKGVKNA